MRHGVVKVERVKAERGPSLIAFDGKEWRKVIRLGDIKNSIVVDKDNNMKICVRANNEWVEIGK